MNEKKKKGYFILKARKEEKRDESTQEDFENVCLPMEMRRGLERGTWTAQDRTQMPSSPSLPLLPLLSIHHILHAALSSLLSLTPTTKLPVGPGVGGGTIHHFTDVATGPERQ